MTADIESIGPETDGVICAMGDWFGGFALYVTKGTVRFSFARAADALDLSAAAPLAAGSRQLGVAYALGGPDTPGRMLLLVDQVVVDEIPVDGILPIALQHGGAGLRLGVDSGFPVSPRYSPPAPFTGVVRSVSIETPGATLPDPADELRAALHAD
jgi:arylsulfatase